MQDRYIIIWIARYRESAGIGRARLVQAAAEQLERELNDRYPAFVHRAIDTEKEDPQQAISALRASLAVKRDSQPTSFLQIAAVQAAIAEPAIPDDIEGKIIQLSGVGIPDVAVAGQ
jgi:hypothetical protein